MLSFEQYGSFDIKRIFGDQEVEHKCILPNTQFQSDISLSSHKPFIPYLSLSNL
jgi:hypothetical protein